MRAYPLLNLNNVALDPGLVEKVPPALASYYMALPVAREDDQVSVVMEHPENDTAVAILSRLLGGKVVPVRGAADDIRSALTRLSAAQPEPVGCVLGWNERPEWFSVVDEWTRLLADLLGARSVAASPTDCQYVNLRSAVSEDRYRLVVADSPLSFLLDGPLTTISGPLLYVRSRVVRPLQRLLVILRGYSSDECALEWALMLMRNAEASLTFMSLNGDGRSISPALRETLVRKTGSFDSYAFGCQSTDFGHPRMYRKVRSGNGIQQVCDEAEDGSYDLIVICAEGDGTFIGQSLTALEQRSPHSGCPVLIVKPTY